MKNQTYLECFGVRTHNLKNINLKLPLKKWIAVTGVSGCGKSSLVFDTIYAESQRRFLETLGTYERQFLQGLPQGEFDSIENIPASVALKQNNKTGDPRSVIATAADIADSMRTLFMAFLNSACRQCGTSVQLNTSQELIDFISHSKSKGKEFILSVPFEFPEDKKQQKKLCQDLLIEGYVRLFVQGKIISLEENSNQIFPKNVELVLDRIHASIEKDELLNRVETLWSQIKFSTRFSSLFLFEMTSYSQPENSHSGPENSHSGPENSHSGPENSHSRPENSHSRPENSHSRPENSHSRPENSHSRPDRESSNKTLFHVQPFCEKCNSKTAIIQSRDLDWQSVLGACSSCHGLGNIPVLDENKIVPNSSLSLSEGAIKPWNSETFEWMKEELLRECKKRKINVQTPYSKLTHAEKNLIWNGEGELPKKQKCFIPLKHFFDVLEQERYKSTSRILLAKYRKYVQCSSCAGTRMGEVGRNAVCFGKKFYELFQCEISETHEWLLNLKKQKNALKKIEALSEIYEEVLNKVSLLVKLGLGSANLFRRCKTLSGGEYQRVLLTRVIGNGLTDALYVLDEPSVGLGKNEIPQLIACLKQLRDLGNTVLMVEHDKSLILAADEWIELGPSGGFEGGYILPSSKNIPLSAISNEVRHLISSSPQKNNKIELSHFSAMNCHNVTIEFYLGKLNVVTGDSGAGKSTLVNYGLQAALEKLESTGLVSNEDFDEENHRGTWKKISVPPQFFEENELVIVEQKVLHRTITSVPATLLGLMDLLRKNFMQTRVAKQNGFSLSDFSFNGEGGCSTCLGKGIVQDDLFFLGQVEKTCPDCKGSRYKNEVLKIEFQGKNISQWLSTTFQECIPYFGREKKWSQALKIACELGLGHVTLGMPTSSLSGGEAQRLRICSALCKSDKKIFCILDEPTRGLSEKDVSNLLASLLRLTENNHTFVVVEHHGLFKNEADFLIKMGPKSGLNGGKIVEKINQFSKKSGN